MPMDMEKRKAWTSAYWKEVRAWRREHHICTTCGKNDAAIGFVQCSDCQEKRAVYDAKYKADHPDYIKETDKALREKRRAAGLCPECGKKIDGIYVRCNSCHDKAKYRLRRLRARNHVDKIRNPNFCAWCGLPVVPGKKLCQLHYDHCLCALKKARAARNTTNHPWKKDNNAAFHNKMEKRQINGAV